jgi:hypothetical protein
MKKFIILYYENETDVFAKQSEIDAESMSAAIGRFEYDNSWKYQPIACYALGLRAMFQSNNIPSSLQKDIQ